MTHSVSRRDALKQVVLLLGVAATARPGQSVQAAADLPHLDPNDPMAKSLNYTDNAKGVDPKAMPMYKPGSACSNCFAGKAVNANGWCQVYVKKG
jgi:hypothetical protein